MDRRGRTLAGFLVAMLAAAFSSWAATQDASALRVDVVARAMLPGEVLRVVVTCDCKGAVPTAFALNAEVPLCPAGNGIDWHGLVGIDLDTPAGTYPLMVQARRAGDGLALEHKTTLRIGAKAFPTRRLRVAPEFVEPPPDDLARIRRDAASLEALFTATTIPLWGRSFQAPIDARPGNTFGARSVFNGQARSAHGGVDYGSALGTAVHAPGAGRIALARDLFFTGNTVIVDHGFRLFSVLAHLSAMAVAEGDRVEAGQAIGSVGATGRVTGPHLHWGVRLNGARVDPLSLLAAAGPDGTTGCDVPQRQ